MIDRNALAAAGWTLPEPLEPMTEEGYEEWRPALAVFAVLTGGLQASTPLDSVDRKKVDALREALVASPMVDLASLPTVIPCPVAHDSAMGCATCNGKWYVRIVKPDAEQAS